MTDYTEKPEESIEAAPGLVEDIVVAGVETEPVEIVAEDIVIPEEPVVIIESPVPAPATPAVKKHADPVKVELEDIENSLPKPAGPAVVGTGERDVVKVSSIVYKNEIARKSLSVHHLQRRLLELGYADAGKDKDGYYGALTRRALVMFQQQNKLDPDGVASLVTLKTLFKDDPNVDVQP